MILLATSGLAFAQASAKTMLEEAYAVVTSKGMTGAASDFNQGGKWKRGTAYVILIEFDGNMLAHSDNPKMVGKHMLEARDANNKAFVQETIHNLKTTGKDSVVNFSWVHPGTRKIQEGTVTARRVAGKDAYLGVIWFD
jgi:cytochrome c